MDQITTLTKMAEQVGIVGILIGFIVGLVRQWWVMGWQYNALAAENKRLWDLLQSGQDVAQKALEKK
jgi:hypothetical protein